MITDAKSGHPGGSLSATEIVVTLFFDVMRHDPANPKWPDRDRFILSKGHCCPILYAVMAECGYCPKDQLNTLRKLGSIYQGHPDVRFIPALEASTGSLGRGIIAGDRHGSGGAARPRVRRELTWCSATAKFRRARSGKRPCSAATTGSTTSCAIVDYNRSSWTDSSRTSWIWSRSKRSGAASAGTSSRCDGHDIAGASESAFARSRRRPRTSRHHHRPYHQRQGRFVHGK